MSHITGIEPQNEPQSEPQIESQIDIWLNHMLKPLTLCLFFVNDDIFCLIPCIPWFHGSKSHG